MRIRFVIARNEYCAMHMVKRFKKTGLNHEKFFFDKESALVSWKKLPIVHQSAYQIFKVAL